MSKEPRATHTDCRSDDGITVGLIDSIINAAHLLEGRNLSPSAVFEAISDLKAQKFLTSLIQNPQKEWRVICRELSDQRLSFVDVFTVESEARTYVGGGMRNGVSLLRTWEGVRKEVGLQRRDFGTKMAWEIVDFVLPRHRDLVKATPDSDLYIIP